METNMIAVVNPITRVATILHKYNDCVYEDKIWFKDLDEWSGFEHDGKSYDIHFHYDEEFEFYISEYKEEVYFGGVQVEYEKYIVYNESDFKKAVELHTLKLQSNGHQTS